MVKEGCLKSLSLSVELRGHDRDPPPIENAHDEVESKHTVSAARLTGPGRSRTQTGEDTSMESNVRLSYIA